MKDKASADTQRTEAVNCMVEITGGERRERGRGERGRAEGDEGRQEQKEGYSVRTDKRRGGMKTKGRLTPVRIHTDGNVQAFL